MTYIRNRVILAIIGFFIIIIPLFFFCYSLDKEYRFSQNRIQENLKERLISSANKLEENLDCYSYLKSEINKIHKELFPLCPEEVLDKIPEDSFTKKLYTKDLLDKIDVYRTLDEENGSLTPLFHSGIKEENDRLSIYAPASLIFSRHVLHDGKAEVNVKFGKKNTIYRIQYSYRKNKALP